MEEEGELIEEPILRGELVEISQVVADVQLIKQQWIFLNVDGEEEEEESEEKLLKIEPEKEHNVMILSCSNITIHIKKRACRLLIDNCKNVTVVMVGMIASTEIVRCDNCTIRCLGINISYQVDMCTRFKFFVDKPGGNELRPVCFLIHKTSACDLFVPKEDSNNGTTQRWEKHEIEKDRPMVFHDEDQFIAVYDNDMKKINTQKIQRSIAPYITFDDYLK